MKSQKETDYRKVPSSSVYELKKVALRLREKGKKVREICELTGLSDKTLLVDKNPEQMKLKGCMWNRDNIREMIKSKYGISMPIRTVGEYLKRWGFTVQRPAKRESNQKPELVETWLNKEYPRIHNAAKNEGNSTFVSKHFSIVSINR